MKLGMQRSIRFGNKQKGLSTIGWIAIIGLLGLISLTLMKIIPMYYENQVVISVLESLKQDDRLNSKSRNAIWNSLRTRLHIQDVDSVQRDHVTMSRKDGKTTVTIAYEVKKNYLFNLFIGAKFNESVVIDQ